jgi:hypothetical protein
LEVAQKNKAAATLTKENAQAQLNNLLQLVTYYDQKRSLSRQQMMVCNQCPKMKEYQDATAAADIMFNKYKAQYTLAEMQAKNADLGVTNATLNSQDAELQAAKGVDTVTTLTQDLQAAEKTCDDKFPEEEKAKFKYNTINEKLTKYNENKKNLINNEMDRLLQEKRSKSYYFSTKAGGHISMEPSLYDAMSTTSKGSLTLSLWVKLSSLGHDSTIICTYGETGGQIYGWTLGVNSKDGFYFDATTEGTTENSIERKRMKSGGDTIELAMNVWYNIAVTWGEEKKMYLNGYNVARGQAGEIMYEPNGNGILQPASKSVTIGALKDGSKWLNGGIDDLALWSRENPPNEIKGRCSKKDSTINILGTATTTTTPSFFELNEDPNVFENKNSKQLLFFLNFGPNFDLGTDITSKVEGSGTFVGEIKRNTTVTWIPDEDSKIFCTPLANTLGRKVIRRLSEKTGYFRRMSNGDCKVNTTKCKDNQCAPQNDGGIALYLTSELFGNGPGQIPNTLISPKKKISNVQLLLSLGEKSKNIDDAEINEKWIMKGFILNDINECIKDSLIDGNTTININKFEKDEGRLTIDMTDQLNKLSQTDDNTTPRGIYIMRADTGVAIKDKLTFFSSAAEVDAPKRPQLVAGVTDGNSPPIKFFKGEVKCPATHTLCTSNEVEASVGFDGYSERRCGTMETVGSMKISRSTNILESCNNPTGLFCCNAV